jgi:hypothetical protein
MMRFAEFSASKTEQAERASIATFVTDAERTAGAGLLAVGNPWTRRHFDGDFWLSPAPAGLPATSLVFVQSRDGNTVADDPSELGGGPTDLHPLYEGLSRVAADGVLAGAATAHGDIFFSVWHPELVALRTTLQLPRHPTQVVM